MMPPTSRVKRNPAPRAVTANTSAAPDPLNTIVSAPAPPTWVSLPSPGFHVKTSLPAPPSSVSLPGPPRIASASSLPVMVSTPPPPAIDTAGTKALKPVNDAAVTPERLIVLSKVPVAVTVKLATAAQVVV